MKGLTRVRFTNLDKVHPWMPEVDIVTTDFSYIRWQGDRKQVNGESGVVERDRSKDVRRWAKKIMLLIRDSLKIYGYFSKFYSGHPPTEATQIMSYLSVASLKITS